MQNFNVKLAAAAFLLSVLSIAGYLIPVLFFAAAYLAPPFSLLYFYYLARNPQRINSFEFFKIAICSGYLLGPGLVIINSNRAVLKDFVLLVGPYAYLGYNSSTSLALSTAYMSFVFLSLVRFSYIASKTKLLLNVMARRGDVNFMDYLFLTAVSLTIVFAFLHGDIGYGGPTLLATGEGVNSLERITALGDISYSAIPAVIPAIAVIVAKERRLSGRFYLIFLLLFDFALVLTEGRRTIIFTALVSMLSILIISPKLRKQVSIKRIIRRPKLSIYLVISTCIVVFGTYAFYAIRTANDQLGASATLVDDLPKAISILSDLNGSFYSSASQEASVRPGTLLVYLGELEASPIQNYMLGQCFANAVLTEVPAILFPRKGFWTNIYFACADEDVEGNFDLPLIDAPTTVITTGYAELGIIGVLIYLVFFPTLMGIALNFFMKSKFISFNMFAFGEIMFSSVFVETGVNNYFDCIRFLLIVYGLMFCVERIFLGLRVSHQRAIVTEDQF